MTEKKRLQGIIYKAKEELAALAVLKYGEGFDGGLFAQAIANKTTTYANALVDDALAFCGYPFCKFSNRKWSIEALIFLSKFTE